MRISEPYFYNNILMKNTISVQKEEDLNYLFFYYVS